MPNNSKNIKEPQAPLSQKSNQKTPNQAVSLNYSGKGAPVVTAKGEGHIAQQIIALAKEHEIPITEDAALVEMLSQVELDQEIPEVLYEAVVQVLIFAYEMSGKSVPSPSSTDNNSSL